MVNESLGYGRRRCRSIENNRNTIVFSLNVKLVFDSYSQIELVGAQLSASSDSSIFRCVSDNSFSLLAFSCFFFSIHIRNRGYQLQYSLFFEHTQSTAYE